MALLKIAQMGNPILRRVADKVHDPQAPEVQGLVADMIETMDDASGVGLAAPQVHESLRIIVFRIQGARAARAESVGGEANHDGVPLTALINPIFEPTDSRQDEDWEGCLSIPGLIGKVPRYRRIRYWGTTLDGRTVVREASGFHARVVQHEIDHLDGVLYPERMSDLATLAFTSEIGRHGEAPADDAPSAA
jgi:peptide deformylase